MTVRCLGVLSYDSEMSQSGNLELLIIVPMRCDAVFDCKVKVPRPCTVQTQNG